MDGDTRGGDDTLQGSGGYETLIGDALILDDDARGGNDLLLGAGGDDVIRTGNAGTSGLNATASGDGAMSDSARGGNDEVYGGTGDDYLLGDGDFGGTNLGGAGVRAGNDRLDGGAGDDTLVGDFRVPGEVAEYGRDTFVFAGAFGNDVVEDFHAGEDRLLFDVPGVRRAADLQITVEEDRTVIAVADGGTVTLLGFTGPLGGDFAFN
jgi:Ca2+-binding RTX toxin-like protein